MEKLSSNLYQQWVSFCRHAVPGARFWIDDDLFYRLCEAMDAELRFYDDTKTIFKIAVQYKGGYEFGGLTFYRKSSFPNPPRRAPGRQEFYAR